EASRRALVALGEVPVVRPGGRVVLVASRAVRQSAATQATVSPAEGLASALRERGVEVVEVPYAAADLQPEAVASRALAVPHPALVVFASTARTLLQGGEVELARRLAGAGAAFVHVALWNPYLVAEV